MAAASTLAEVGAVDVTSTTAATGMGGTTGMAAAIMVAVDGTAAVAARSGRAVVDTQAVAVTAVAVAKTNTPSSFAARRLMSERSTSSVTPIR